MRGAACAICQTSRADACRRNASVGDAITHTHDGRSPAGADEPVAPRHPRCLFRGLSPGRARLLMARRRIRTIGTVLCRARRAPCGKGATTLSTCACSYRGCSVAERARRYSLPRLADRSFPVDYPHEPPECKFGKAPGGEVLFHPNVYSDGTIYLRMLTPDERLARMRRRCRRS